MRGRFDPLELPDPQNVARIYVPRPDGPRSHLIEYLGRDAPRRICLLAGQRSSGKTTELFQVMQELKEDYLIVAVNLAEILPPEEFGILDVLFALGAALYRTAEDFAPGRLDRHLYTDLLAGMGKSVHKWVESRQAGIAVPALAKSLAVLAIGFVGGPGVAATVGKVADKALEALNLKQAEVSEIERRFAEPPRPAEVLRSLRAIIEALSNKVADRSLLLLADGLDALHPVRSLDVASREDILSALPCRAVFVVPPDLRIALDAPALQKVALIALPNLPVTGPYGQGDLPNATLRFFDELVARRLPEGLARPNVVGDEQLDVLARSSGGVIRDFVWMVYHACGAAARMSKPLLDRACIEYGIAELAQTMGPRAMRENARAILRQVAKDHVLPEAPESLSLVHHNLVLLYRAGRESWYDVHPIVKAGLLRVGT